MTKTNIKLLLEKAGIEDPRPTNEALKKMGISRRRFTQLLENVNKTPMSVNELNSISAWIEGFKAIDTEQIVTVHSRQGF